MISSRCRSVLLVCISSFLARTLCKNVYSLYSPDDPLLQITGLAQFDRQVYRQNLSFFVEFYASWCGHCVSFAPTFQRFARSVHSWNKFVTIVTVNCVVDLNSDLCRQHKISMYPTLKYFKRDSTGDQDGITINNGDETVAHLRKSLAQSIRDDPGFKDHRFPSVNMIQKQTGLEQLWKRAHAEAGHVIVLIDLPAPSSVALETVLDFSPVTDRVALFLSPADGNIAVQHSLSGPDALPGLVVFEKGSVQPVYVSKEPHPSVSIIRQRILFHTNVKMGDIEFLTKPDTTLPPRKSRPAAELFVHKTDLLSALRHIFYEEVRKFEHIRGEKLKILRDFIEVVVKYFPANRYEHTFLLELTAWLNSLTSQLPSNVWVSRLNQLQHENDNPLPESDDWKGCRGSEPKFRGFPCSLWVLFHTLTVQAYQKEGGSNAFRPTEIITAFKLFVREFFGCHYCAKNFQNETARLERDVRRPADVVLYLWRVHNDVNARLKGKASEDPLFAKEQFPSAARCPLCWDAREQRWDEAQVLRFLIGFYTPAMLDARPMRGRGRLAPSLPAAGSDAPGGPDRGLCLLLWAGSVLIALAACYYFRRRLKHNCLRSMVKYNLV